MGHVMQTNPALSVRGPKHVVRKGKTPILDAAEVRVLLDSISGTSHIDLRDKALIALMLYSFARIGAVVAMKVEDAFTQNRRLWVRLHEKGGKLHDMPCNHNAEAFLRAYIDGTGIAGDAKGPLFCTVGRDGKLTGNALHRVNAFELVRKRAAAARLRDREICVGVVDVQYRARPGDAGGHRNARRRRSRRSHKQRTAEWPRVVRHVQGHPGRNQRISYRS